MKALSIIFLLFFTTIAYGQCDQLTTVEQNNTITTETPSKIKEFSISKIWFSDYTPPASLFYLFLNADGTYLENEEIKEKSKTSNVTIHFEDSSKLELRMIIGKEYVEGETYNYQTIIFLNPALLSEISSKKITHYELFGFSTTLSDRKSRKLFDYINCMINDKI